MPSPTAPVKQHEAFLEETKSLLHPGNFQVPLVVHILVIDSVGKHVKSVPAMFMGNFHHNRSFAHTDKNDCVRAFICWVCWTNTNTNAGGDHEKTAQPIVRANRRCFKLPFFDPSGKASCFPNICLKTNPIPNNCIGSFQEGQVMYRTSPDCRKGWLWFFPVQVRKT